MKSSETHVGVFDAKARLSELIDRALAGEAIVVTRHGRPVVRLVPESSGDPDSPRAQSLIERIRAGRTGLRLGPGLTIRQLIDEGRR